MISLGRAAFPGLAALFFVWMVFYGWTLGFKAFTSYAYVVASAAPMPKVPPKLALTDQSGGTWSLDQLKGQYHLITFGYLNCTGTCPISQAELNQLNDQLLQRGQTHFNLWTLTLDPEGDRLELLKHTWDFKGAPQNWRMASPTPMGREAYFEILRNMGMWVDEDRFGNPIHDNLSFLINPQGLLVRSYQGIPELNRLLADTAEGQ